jgi:sugar-specific transcriptional regulator TrmB
MELAHYGLSLTQARIYLLLLSKGATSARTISKSLGVHRVDVYRKLKELEILGLLETYVDYPKRFKAIEPKNAMAALIQRHEKKLEYVREKSAELIPRLSQLQRSATTGSETGADLRNKAGSYRLVLGQERYIQELRRLVGNAQLEIVRILSSGGVIRNSIAQMDKAYAKAKARGVTIRMMAETSPSNLPYAKRLARIVQLRRMNDVKLRFIAVDKSVSILSARYDESTTSLGSPEDVHLLLDDSLITEGLCNIFEHVWMTAVPI